jgi:hypothetical protein
MDAVGERRPPVSDAGGGWSSKTFLGGLVVVLVVRLAYLARYGWDLGWMNLGYLSHARLIALGLAHNAEEQPLAFFALVGARRLGLSALQANEAVYLVGHAALTLGALAIARFIWPDASARRRGAVVATLALVPLLASQSGRNNIGVTLATGLATAALGLAASAATVTRFGAGTVARLGLATLIAGLASMGRYEALATCGAGAVLLAFLGRRMPEVPGHRRAALALAVGALGGLAAVLVIRRALAGGVPADKTYAFYTFFDGLPLLMYPHLPGTEYGRYLASAKYFGGFDANHGSLVSALLHHPGYAVLRFLTKPVDLLAVLLWTYGLTPIGVALAVFGLRGIQHAPRETWSRGWMLTAYLLPLGMLFIPQQNPAYYVGISVPLVLAIARGIDRLGRLMAPARGRMLAAATAVAALVLVVGAGKPGVSNSRAINQAVPYLEERCRAGCLTNVLPQALREQAWVVTDAGAPFPPREHRSEQTITGARAAQELDRYDYCGRVARSRAAGFGGPVLYIDSRIRSFSVFDADFDPEVRYQGTVDRADLVEETRFSAGRDEVVIFRLPADRSCRHAAD